MLHFYWSKEDWVWKLSGMYEEISNFLLIYDLYFYIFWFKVELETQGLEDLLQQIKALKVQVCKVIFCLFMSVISPFWMFGVGKITMIILMYIFLLFRKGVKSLVEPWEQRIKICICTMKLTDTTLMKVTLIYWWFFVEKVELSLLNLKVGIFIWDGSVLNHKHRYLTVSCLFCSLIKEHGGHSE